MKSELRCLFNCFICQLRKALIGSSSPISSSSSSSNYTLFFSRLFFVLCLLASLFSFWLGYAFDHRPHTPTTTPFQYLTLQIPISRCPYTSIGVLLPAALILAGHKGGFEGLDGHSMRLRGLV